MKTSKRIIFCLLFAYLFHTPESLFSQHIKWAKETWGGNISAINALHADKSGNSYITGRYHISKKTVDGITLTGEGRENIFVAKYDKHGSLSWVTTSTSPVDYATAQGTGIALDKQGNVFSSGHFSDKISFGDINLATSYKSNMFLVKYDPLGEVIWAKQLGGAADSDFCYDIQTDDEGNAYITGTFHYPFPIDSTVLQGNNIGLNNLLIAKFNPEGELLWAKTGKSIRAPSIKVTAAGDIFFFGEFQHYVEWDDDSIYVNPIISISNLDHYLARMNTDGQIQWFTHISSESNQNVYDLEVDQSNHAYIIGEFRKEVQIGDSLITNLPAIPDNSACVVKFDTAGKFSWITSLSGDTSQYHADKLIIDKTGDIYAFGAETEFINAMNYMNYKNYGLLRHTLDPFSGGIKEARLYTNVPDPINIRADAVGDYYLYGFFENNVQFEDTTIFAISGYYGSYLACLAKTNTAVSPPLLEMKIYPNPANKWISIQMDPSILFPISCTIYDTNGKIASSQQIHESTATIDISNFARGTYFLKLTTRDGIMISKWIKY